jgi:acyl-CoA thioesterase FadM
VEGWDIDMLGHVDNAIYATVVEQATVQALADAG